MNALMKRPPLTIAAALVLVIALLGCSGLGGGSSFAQYTAKLFAKAGVAPPPTRCEMFGGTRLGYCSATAPVADVDALVNALPLASDPETTFYGDSCASVIGFGTTHGSGRFDLLPGTRLYRPNGALPPNTNNVRLNAIVVSPSGGEVCFEYQFPYG